MYIGIIYNWKGLKEENYLYTLDEMAKNDFGLLKNCIANPGVLCEGTLNTSANKTYQGILLKNEIEVMAFLAGRYNADIEEMKENNPDTDYSDWYWDNCTDNDFYDKKSETLENFITNYNIRVGVCGDNHCPLCGGLLKYICEQNNEYQCISCGEKF